MKTLEEYKNELLNDPKLKEKYNKDKVKMEIASIIIKARKERKQSQKDFCDDLKLNKQTISKLEQGKSNPRVDYLSEVLLTLGYRLTIKKIGED